MDVSLWPIVIAPESLIFLSVSCALAIPDIAHAASRATSSVETRFMSLSPWFDDGRKATMIQSSLTDTPCPDGTGVAAGTASESAYHRDCIVAGTGAMTTGAVRYEHDLLGERAVPADAYYGVHTLRAVENFPIT